MQFLQFYCINGHLRNKGYLNEVDGIPVLGNSEEIFDAEQDKLHLPAQVAFTAPETMTKCFVEW